MLKVKIPMRFTTNPATETNCGYTPVTKAHGGKRRKMFYVNQQGVSDKHKHSLYTQLVKYLRQLRKHLLTCKRVQARN